MAIRRNPSPRTPAQLAALKALNSRPRGPRGAPLSNDALAARAAEELQRFVDMQFMSPQQIRRLTRSAARAAEVKHEKESRYARIRSAPDLYSVDSRDAEADEANIHNGVLPRPTQTVNHAGVTEVIWMWRGPHALAVAQEFLLLAKTALPSDSMGYLAMGNGRGKNSTWIGTKFGTPQDVFHHSQTFLTSQSSNTVALNALPHAERDSSIWAEVKMTTQGRVTYAVQPSVKKKGLRKSASGSSARKKAGATKRR